MDVVWMLDIRVIVSVAKSRSLSLKADWRTRGQIQDMYITLMADWSTRNK